MCRLLLLLLGVLVVVTQAAPRPQDPSTNNIVRDMTTEEDRASVVAGLILAVAHDWEMGLQDAIEFVRAVPAISLNGTTYGPTTHPITEAGTVDFGPGSTASTSGTVDFGPGSTAST